MQAKNTCIIYIYYLFYYSFFKNFSLLVHEKKDPVACATESPPSEMDMGNMLCNLFFICIQKLLNQ